MRHPRFNFNHYHNLPQTVHGAVDLVDFDYNDQFHQGLAGPIWEQYGSFAGDFSVNGKLIWDLKTNTIIDEGSEEVREWKDYRREVEI